MTQQYVENDDVTVLGGVVAGRVSERVPGVRFGAERQQLVKASHLVSEHGEVERRPTQRGRRQMNVTLHIIEVLQHPAVALRRVTDRQGC